jgi:ribosome-associated heat shock protein Hsp15
LSKVESKDVVSIVNLDHDPRVRISRRATQDDMPAPAEDSSPPAPSSQRLDKWLWFTRMLKSRTLAADLVSAGKVRLNGERVTKPSQTVKTGDTLTFVLHERPRVLEVVAGGDRRGSAPEAQQLYKDLSPPPVLRAAEPAQGQRDAGTGRPTKRDRRELEKWRDAGD